MVESLVGLLRQQDRAARRLVRVVRDRVEAELRFDLGAREDLLDAEREVLTDLVLVERERIAALTEIGLILGHRTPSRLRLAELALYTDPGCRDELLEARDRLYAVADELDVLLGASGRLDRSCHGRVTVFSTPGHPANSPEPDESFHAEPSDAESAFPASGIDGTVGAELSGAEAGCGWPADGSDDAPADELEPADSLPAGEDELSALADAIPWDEWAEEGAAAELAEILDDIQLTDAAEEDDDEDDDARWVPPFSDEFLAP